jgi:hypothetical protein
MLSDSGLTGVSDYELQSVIETGKGSARGILDSVAEMILKARSIHESPTS